MNYPLRTLGALLCGSLLWAAPVRADDKADLQAAFDEGNKLQAAGKFKEAAAQFEKAVRLAPTVLGENSPSTAMILNNLGRVYDAQRKFAQAEPVYLRALQIYQKAHGDEHASVALVLQNLAILNANQKKFAAAEPLFQRSLAMREKLLGKDHLEVANSLNALAILYTEQAKYAAAEDALRRALAIREKAQGKENPVVLYSLNQLANVYKQQKKFIEAEALYLREVAIREKINGKEHADVAATLDTLAALYREQRQYADAEPLYQRSLAIREKILGKEHLQVVPSLNRLADLYVEQGKYALAELLYRRCLAIAEKIHGKDHPAVALPLSKLANVYSSQGKYADAEPLHQRSLIIYEKVFGPEHLAVAETLSNLGEVYAAQRKYAQAESFYRRSLAIREKVLGKEHRDVATSLTYLASLCRAQKQYETAEALLLRSLVIKEKVLGAEHPEVAWTLTNLGNVYTDYDKRAEAETLHKRSLSIYEKAYGKEHPTVANSLNNLALLYEVEGKYAAAEPLYLRCLDIYEKTHGKDHPNVVACLGNLAVLHERQGKYADAARLRTQVQQSTRQFVLRELPSLSVREQQAFLKRGVNARMAASLTLGYRQTKEAAIVEASAAWLLNGKAIALESQSIRSRLEREVSDVEGQAAIREIQAIRAKEAALALQSKQPEAVVKQREQLEMRRRDLEKKLAQQSSTAVKLANPWVELTEVRRKIPADGMLIDIAHFPIFRHKPKPGEPVWAPFRYIAWLIPAAGAGDIRSVDLGNAATIDRAILAARQALESTVDGLEKRQSEKQLEADAAEKLAAVAKLVFDPLKPHLGNAKKLILSPDGDLWLLPWAALPVGKDRYLIEDYSLRFVVTGRDLVDYAVGQKPETTVPLILADPDYNLTPAQVAEARPMRNDPDNDVAALTRSIRDELRGIGRVKRLPGTVAESKQAFDKLKTLTGQEPRLYLEGQASETVVKATRSPRVLVLATHGFFLKPPEEDPTSESGEEKKPVAVKGKEGKEVENPLLRCGLLLAGANKRAQAKEGEDDGILTGLEIVGLDLRGTQMVVLSACETAVGEVQTGDGVAGLRQAFQLAGAESVLATLWQISDSATGQLMNTFYDELAKGTERSEALTLAQRQFIKVRRETTGAAHPFFWASFTLTGK